MDWYNKPPFFDVTNNARISITSAPKTGFWRKTQGNVIRDTGHFLYRSVDGDFSFTAKVTAKFQKQHDQAGLMIRVDDTTWAQCGIELAGSALHVNVVVTRDHSDLSLTALPQNTQAVWLSMARKGRDLEAAYSLDGERYLLLRVADLSDIPALQAGVMSASPEGDGFPSTFDDLKFKTLK